jgi:hypothetical protein
MMALWKRGKLRDSWARSLQTYRSLQRWSRGYQANTAPLCYPPATRSQKLEMEGAGAGAAD